MALFPQALTLPLIQLLTWNDQVVQLLSLILDATGGGGAIGTVHTAVVQKISADYVIATDFRSASVVNLGPDPIQVQGFGATVAPLEAGQGFEWSVAAPGNFGHTIQITVPAGTFALVNEVR